MNLGKKKKWGMNVITMQWYSITCQKIREKQDQEE